MFVSCILSVLRTALYVSDPADSIVRYIVSISVLVSGVVVKGDVDKMWCQIDKSHSH